MRDSRLYILDAKGNPVRESDMLKWADWFQECADRTVMREYVSEDVEVITSFLGMDHNFRETGPPVLWETMVFGGVLDQHQDRCAGSREQSEAMHAGMVERVRQAQGAVKE